MGIRERGRGGEREGKRRDGERDVERGREGKRRDGERWER